VSMSGWMLMRSMTRDSDVVDRRLTPGTTRRVLGYARPFLRPIIVFLVLVVLDAFVMVAVPLLLKDIVDDGVTPKDSGVVVRLSLVVAAWRSWTPG
jgi:ATP-binding cassette, subfamily B, bacterial